MTTYKVKCSYCEKTFNRPIKDKTHGAKNEFCDHNCQSRFREATAYTELDCNQCGKSFRKAKRHIGKNNFCSQSCAASFNNKLKRKSRRSKCEKMLFKLISDKFTNLTILANDKTMLDGLEIDIAIPELSLGIEWNGIVHFKPIYGLKKLSNVQKQDQKKQKLAKKKKINLIVVPDLVSTKKKVNDAFKYIEPIIQMLKNQHGGM